LDYVSLINKSAIISLLKTIDSLMGTWNCGVIYNLMDDCAGTKDEEHQDYQDYCANPDECGWGYLSSLGCVMDYPA
jgi:hypothetical protein